MEENDNKTIEVKFTDVMRVIADEKTSNDNKQVFIFLLNAIMELDEVIYRVEAIQKKCNCSNKKD